MPAPLFLERTPCDSYLSRPCSEMSKSLSCLPAPGSFQITGFILYLHGLFVCCLFMGGDSASSHHPGSAKVEPIDFKIPGFKFYCC